MFCFFLRKGIFAVFPVVIDCFGFWFFVMVLFFFWDVVLVIGWDKGEFFAAFGFF